MTAEKIALVTGANKGLGFETSRQLAQKGIHVIMGARSHEKGAAAADKLKAEGLITKLVKQGYPAFYYEVKVRGRVYYRIRCGRFTERPEAADYARKLEKEAGIKGFVSRLE